MTFKLISGVTAKIPADSPPRHWTTYAKGARKQRGEMNQTEQKFRDEWIMPQVADESIAWWAYEAIQFKLTEKTPGSKPGIRYTPDFVVMDHSGIFHIYEVKGTGPATRESLNRLKLLADKFPFRCFLATRQTKKDGGGFRIEEY